MKKEDITRPHRTGRGASGRFVLRLDPALHARLRQAAHEQGLSLNAYCARRLAAQSVGLSALPGPAEVVSRAVSLFGALLVGVAAYGSWARGEAVAASDVDVLIVLEREARLGRDLYRRWDEEGVEWDGRPVEPHFVILPNPDQPVAGLWAEAALDGIVLCDASLRLSARLVQVRRAILEGRIVRRTSHGQPYWVSSEVA